MKYERKTSKNIKDNFLLELLKDREILVEEKDYNKFFYPTKDNEIDSSLLDNIDKACEMLHEHLTRGNKIYLVVD